LLTANLNLTSLLPFADRQNDKAEQDPKGKSIYKVREIRDDILDI
jgi:hypothetical protein